MHKNPGFFTIDVEEYYHIIGVRGTPEIATWDRLPTRVDIGLNRLFDLLSQHEVKSTLFFLGYMAQRHPHLVKKAIALGHEIASHGMYHIEVKGQNRKEFTADAKQSKHLLEDIGGKPVIGYRSAGFSINHSTPWFFEALIEAGFSYDSSLVPNRTQQRKLFPIPAHPASLKTPSGSIYEFPICVADLAGIQVSMFGGGYLRFFPHKMLENAGKKTVLKRPLLIYIHPRELDPVNPHLSINLFRKFKSYINISSVPQKLESLLNI
ncbi:MAG: polysaccharide deacetylase family protein, partial [Candidatus Cloacimonadaceae bacterium]|nr:polysaccharide deacetylase family protein [Candidatus Cloacimonadaceae bacterium]